MTALSFPISIGLVGAPGSGKSKIADEFHRISSDWFESYDQDIWVLENAGTTIERNDQAMGIFGSWAEDLRAYFVRYEAEQDAIRGKKSYLTLGTAIDHIAHSGVNLENILTGLSTPDQQIRIQQQQVTMTALTFLFTRGFRYTFGFYVPYAGTILLPGQDEAEATYNRRVDGALRQIFGNFGLRIQMLDQPSIEEKAQEMFDTVKRIVENGPEFEDPGENITDTEDLSDETKAELEAAGIALPTWTPEVPPAQEDTLSE